MYAFMMHIGFAFVWIISCN